MSDEMDRWLDEATPDEVTVKVPLARRLAAEYHKAREELLTARETQDVSQPLLDDGNHMVALAEKVADLERQVEQSARPFTFRCLERERRKELVRKHPPTDEQRKLQADRNKQLPPQDRVPPEAMVDPDGFYPELVAACCTTPGMTVDQAVKLRDMLPDAVWGEIVDAVEQVNVEGTSIPKHERSIAALLRSELNSISSATEVSLSPSSEAGR